MSFGEQVLVQLDRLRRQPYFSGHPLRRVLRQRHVAGPRVQPLAASGVRRRRRQPQIGVGLGGERHRRRLQPPVLRRKRACYQPERILRIAPATRRLLRLYAMQTSRVASRSDTSWHACGGPSGCRIPPLTCQFVAPPAGLEPATRCLEGSRSIQLSYRGGKPFRGAVSAPTSPTILAQHSRIANFAPPSRPEGSAGRGHLVGDGIKGDVVVPDRPAVFEGLQVDLAVQRRRRGGGDRFQVGPSRRAR